MKQIKAYLLTLLFSVVVFTVWGQGKEQTAFPHFIIDTNGDLHTERSNNVTNISVNGGFIKIRPLDNIFHQLTSRTYFTSKSGNTEKTNKNNLSNEIYLRVGDIYSVDILDRKSDRLIHRYNINRTASIPQIQLFLTENGKKREIRPKKNEATKVNSTNAKSIELKRMDKLDLSVEYKLVNLSTKRTVDNNIIDESKSLDLKQNTEYELRINYLVQPESVQIIYITNEGAWYQRSSSFLAFGVIFLAIIVALILKKMTNKVRISASELKKMEESAIRLQSMLNPHFTFNALSTVQGLMNTGRIDEANLYLENFGSLLRQSLAKSKTLYHSLDQELEMMRMYLSLEALRFNFEWKINIDKDVQLAEIEIPTLLLQPLIENAIKHGLKNVEQGKITLSCKIEKDSLIVSIEDNGIWIDNPTGYGLRNTQERIATINKMRNNQAIGLNFDRSQGTTATLTFFNWLKND